MRLLIVEDERGMAEGLRGLLEHQGYAVDLAADGEARAGLCPDRAL